MKFDRFYGFQQLLHTFKPSWNSMYFSNFCIQSIMKFDRILWISADNTKQIVTCILQRHNELLQWHQLLLDLPAAEADLGFLHLHCGMESTCNSENPYVRLCACTKWMNMYLIWLSLITWSNCTRTESGWPTMITNSIKSC